MALTNFPPGAAVSDGRSERMMLANFRGKGSAVRDRRYNRH